MAKYVPQVGRFLPYRFGTRGARWAYVTRVNKDGKPVVRLWIQARGLWTQEQTYNEAHVLLNGKLPSCRLPKPPEDVR